MPNCYVCNAVIEDENVTEEHILLNSIGGRLRSTRLICKTCNSTFGSSVDSELSNQLNFFANILMIKRERGKPPPVLMEKESTGEKYFVDHNGKPQIAKPSVIQKANDVGTEISIQARNMNEARQILTGLKKKYPTMNIDAILASAKIIQEPIDEYLHIKLVIGGKESLPAILKMAINYYIEKTGDIESVKSAIDDLKRNISTKAEPIILNDRIFILEDKEITHSIFINGEKSSKRLYAIIELYSTIQFVVKLSDNYNKEDFIDLYVFDVLERAEKAKKPINIPSHDFVFSFLYPSSEPDFSKMQDAMSRCMEIAMERQHLFFQNEMIKSTWENTIDKLIPENGVITKEAADAFTDELMKQLEPYLIRMIKNKDF